MIRINQSKFQEILDRIKPAISKSVIENNNNKIYLSITDKLLFVNTFHISEDINIHTYMECETDTDTLKDNNTRELIIDYNMLYKTWKELSYEKVLSIELPEHLNEANKLSKNKSIKIKSQQNTYTLKVIEPPTLQVKKNLQFIKQEEIDIDSESPRFEKFTINAQGFLKASTAVSFLAPGMDNLATINMNGILVNNDCLVATNGFAIGKISMDNNNFNEGKKSCFLSPHTIRCMQSIIKNPKDNHSIEIFFANNSAYIYYEDFTIISSQMENKFPNYEKVMTTYDDFSCFVCPKDVLLNTLNRMMLYAPKEKNYKTKILINDTFISLSTYNNLNELGASEDISCDIQKNDGNNKIFLNCDLFRNIISRIAIQKNDDIYIFFRGEKEHIIIRDKDNIYYYRMTQILHDE